LFEEVVPWILLSRNITFVASASTFDFSDLGTIAGVEIDHSGDTALAADGSSADDLPLFQGRDRAFSFEVFNFNGGDDLLPPTVESSMPSTSLSPVPEDMPMSRPRGDSIIFDPISFQDGGIHEKNALEKAAAQREIQPHAVNSMPAPTPLVVGSSSHAPSRPRQRPSQPAPRGRPPASAGSRNPPPAPGRPGMSQKSTSGPNGSFDDSQTATLPSGLVDDPQNPTTFQMELLNKDGRIGIYLPDARKARIARFHAKRKMRIWRKRIKYDCRKKLADSRPRIKGRFVKRSDMDE
jgi:CCT motif